MKRVPLSWAAVVAAAAAAAAAAGSQSIRNKQPVPERCNTHGSGNLAVE